jgi:VWFA-related protein
VIRAPLLLVCVPLLLQAASTAQQQPTFRAGTDVVSVDVVVRDGGRPVRGLTPGDFAVRDNGVSQAVERVDVTAAPIDVTLLVDVSGPINGVWTRPRPMAEAVAEVNDAARQIAVMLRPVDRLRVVTVDEYVEEAVPMQQAAAVPSIEEVASGGRAGVHDALVAALLRPVEPDRRHFVFAFTKAIDAMSVVDAAAVREIARRSDAVLHVVQQDAPLLAEDQLQDCQCFWMKLCQPAVRFALPIPRRAPMSLLCDPDVPAMVDPRPRAGRHVPELTEAAAFTGGALHDAGFLATRDVVGTFREVFDDFRQGYVLQYTAQGVRREGWHEIAVTVPDHPEYTVQARGGYAVEAAAAAGRVEAPRVAPGAGPPILTRETVAAAAAGSGGVRITPSDVADAYARGDYDLVGGALSAVRDLREFVEEARQHGSFFPASPRRDAAFVLEVAAAALRRQDARDEALEWLTEYDRLVRNPLGPDDFECRWYWAEVVAFEGLIAPELGLPFATRALERCPDEPRLHLALAVLTDQQWPLGTTRQYEGQRFMAAPSDDQLREVPARYRAALAFPETEAEARVRLAWFLHRTGQSAEGRRVLQEAANLQADRLVVYLGDLVLGQIRQHLGDLDGAAEAFESALTTWPGAQAARVSLMSVELARGRRAEAGALAEAIQRNPADETVDPWWLYWQGDHRAWAAIAASVRQAAQ